MRPVYLNADRIDQLQAINDSSSLWPKQTFLPSYMGSSAWMYRGIELVQKVCEFASHFTLIAKVKEVGVMAKGGVFVGDMISTLDVSYDPICEARKASEASLARRALKVLAKTGDAVLNAAGLTQFFLGHCPFSPAARLIGIAGNCADFAVSASSCYRAYTVVTVESNVTRVGRGIQSIANRSIKARVQALIDRSKNHHFWNAVKAISSLAVAILGCTLSLTALAGISLLGVVAAIGKDYYKSGGVIEPFDGDVRVKV